MKRLLVWGACWLMLVGCSRPQPTFVYSEGTKGLLDDARKTVQAILLENFGTPTKMVAWERMPVDFGGIRGTVREVTGVTEEGYVKVFSVDLEDPKEADKIAAGQRLLFTSGTWEDTEVPLASFDPQSGEVTLAKALSDPPETGSAFVIDFGRVLKHGRLLYAEHCQHCHGVSGDGNGPTARYLNPHPRDYRLGKFKFTSTAQTEKARREDLARTIRQGIPGTYMPSFLLLKDDEVHALVEYVRWLAMRGELERRMLVELEVDFSKKALDEQIKSGQERYRADLERWKAGELAEKPEPFDVQALRSAVNEELASRLETFREDVDQIADDLANAWLAAERPEAVVIPPVARTPDTPESRARGRILFLKNCATCHGATGRGDGPMTEQFQEKPGTTEKYDRPGLFDDWGNPIQPRDLTTGVYRGGRRPLDLYRRIQEGIKGTPMPPFKGEKLSPAQTWDVVNYVLHLPFEPVPEDSTLESRRMASREAQP